MLQLVIAKIFAKLSLSEIVSLVMIRLAVA
jgi:hypothetical protein